MLFEFEINNNRNDLLEYDESYLLGNSFSSLYEEYKNYKPKNIKVTCERDAHLVKLMALYFYIHDINLKLILDKDNEYLYDVFKKYTLLYKKCLNEYESKYQVLNLMDDTYDKYTYINNPWPWEETYV